MGTFSPGSTWTWSAASSGGSLKSPTRTDRTWCSASYVMASPTAVTSTERTSDGKIQSGVSGRRVRRRLLLLAVPALHVLGVRAQVCAGSEEPVVKVEVQVMS